MGAQKTAGGWVILKDWEIIALLNPLADKPRSLAVQQPAEAGLNLAALIEDAGAHVARAMGQIDVPFNVPLVEPLALLVPARA